MVRFRIRYEKVGPIRYTSHRDLLRIFRRCLATADVPVCYSQGFNPHPRISFGPSLRTGWESLDEYLDVLLERPVDDLTMRCNTALPEGLEILEMAQAETSVPKLSADVMAARYQVTVDAANLAPEGSPQWADFVRRAQANGHAGKWPLAELEDDLRRRFPSGAASVDGGAGPSLLEINVDEQGDGLRIEYLSTMHQGKGIFPDVLEPYFGDPDGMTVPFQVVRKALFVARRGAFLSPINKGVVQNLL